MHYAIRPKKDEPNQITTFVNKEVAFIENFYQTL